MHPKFPDKAKIELFKLALDSNPNSKDTSCWEKPDELIIASDINISECSSNIAYISAIFGIPPIMCLFPSDGLDGKQERIDKGYKDGLPPLVVTKAGWGARNEKHLKVILSSIMNHEDKMKERVRKNSKVFRPLLENTGAAERIVDVVENSMLARRGALR